MPDAPTSDEKDDFLLSCRFGDLDDVQHFLASFSDPKSLLDAIRDDNGNTVLHMVAANGHADVLDVLLPHTSPHLLVHRNHAGSTALHWAAVNRHLDIAKRLVEFPDGPGIDLIDIKNDAGRSPLGEAELVGWDEGARWFVQMMHLDEVKEEMVDEADTESQVEIEIQDAEGQVARMAIRADRPSESQLNDTRV